MRTRVWGGALKLLWASELKPLLHAVCGLRHAALRPQGQHGLIFKIEWLPGVPHSCLVTRTGLSNISSLLAHSQGQARWAGGGQGSQQGCLRRLIPHPAFHCGTPFLSSASSSSSVFPSSPSMKNDEFLKTWLQVRRVSVDTQQILHTPPNILRTTLHFTDENTETQRH